MVQVIQINPDSIQELEKNLVQTIRETSDSERIISLYQKLILAYLASSNTKLAKERFKEMTKQGFKPDYVIYTAMILGYTHDREIEEAEVLFGELEKELRNWPNTARELIIPISYERITKAYYGRYKNGYNHFMEC